MKEFDEDFWKDVDRIQTDIEQYPYGHCPKAYNEMIALFSRIVHASDNVLSVTSSCILKHATYGATNKSLLKITFQNKLVMASPVRRQPEPFPKLPGAPRLPSVTHYQPVDTEEYSRQIPEWYVARRSLPFYEAFKLPVTDSTFQDYLDIHVFKTRKVALNRDGVKTREEKKEKQSRLRKVQNIKDDPEETEDVITSDIVNQKGPFARGKPAGLRNSTSASSGNAIKSQKEDDDSSSPVKYQKVAPKDRAEYPGLRMKRNSTRQQGYIAAVNGNKFVVKWVQMDNLDDDEVTENMGKGDIVQ